MKTIVVCSGGLDSITLAYQMADEHTLCSLISFDYGQRHHKELTFAQQCAKALNVPHTIIDLKPVGIHLTGSALTDDIEVPEGHYAEESMKSTVVPNRNTIMLTVAFGYAVSQQAEQVAIAVHGGDHFIYPDCRPAFIESFATMQQQALSGIADIALLAPYLHKSKSDIVKVGTQQGVPFQDTWSCYQGQQHHCGRCGTCVERQEAFHLAQVKDPTHYSDPHFWQNSIQQHFSSNGEQHVSN